MDRRRRIHVTILGLLLGLGLAAGMAFAKSAGTSPARRPNVVLILADDMGYGDVHALNKSSKIPTPNLDSLAAEGMTFTDAHTPSAVCTPTRYGLLTGRYCWRSELKRGVLSGYSPPLIEKGRQTLASILKKAGYHTACIGKWHLGIDWNWKAGKADSGARGLRHLAAKGAIDYDKPVSHGPVAVGFDTCYIVPGSLDMGPYVFVRDSKVVKTPSLIREAEDFPVYIREGEMAEGFEHINVLDHLLAGATEYIGNRAGKDRPFFLYFPLTAPHKPVMPHPRFQGKSALGPYGDFVIQVDWTVGQLLDTLDEHGIANNTLVIMTSDNGSFMYKYTDGRNDHVDDETVQGFRPEHHTSNADWRGTKADIFEAGHRVPFFVRWPDRVKAGTKTDRTICLTDILATCADLTGQPFSRADSQDSYSFLGLLEGSSDVKRPAVVHHSSGGVFAIRQGKMKLVLGNGSGGREQPKGQPFGKPYQLFNLAADPAERNNIAKEQPETVERLTKMLTRIGGNDVDLK